MFVLDVLDVLCWMCCVGCVVLDALDVLCWVGDLLRTSVTIKVVIIPPYEGGGPRR